MIIEVIKAISDTNCILEINTRGYYKFITKELYHSKQILEKCFEADITVKISSDSHNQNEIDQNLEDVE